MFRGKPAGTLRHVRYHASADLTFWVEHYWIVEWNLVEPYVAQNLPHPSVHLVIGDDDARVVGARPCCVKNLSQSLQNSRS